MNKAIVWFVIYCIVQTTIYAQSGSPPKGDPIFIVWQTHDDNIPLDGNPNGTGKRIFPEKKSLSDVETGKRRIVEAKAIISPPIADKTIYFKVFDVDDASSSLVIDPNGDVGPDNFQESDPSTVNRSAATDANGEATIEFTVTRHPGNNYRVYAGRSDPDVKNVDQTQADSGSVPSSVCMSDILTVWRMLHLEIDSMGSEPQSEVFEADDTLRGDVPDPDIGALQNSLKPCYIDIDTQAFSQFSTSSEPWNHNFGGRRRSMNYYAAFINGAGNSSPISHPYYWGLQIIGAYEYWDIREDNDDNELERGTIGETSILPDVAGTQLYCIIFNETLKDMAADPAHVTSLSHLSQEVVVHEVGHTLGAVHNFTVPPQTVMWSYQGYPFNEHYIAQTVLDFSDEDISGIRNLDGNAFEN